MNLPMIISTCESLDHCQQPYQPDVVDTCIIDLYDVTLMGKKLHNITGHRRIIDNTRLISMVLIQAY